jgi:hypothetical protein
MGRVGLPVTIFIEGEVGDCAVARLRGCMVCMVCMVARLRGCAVKEDWPDAKPAVYELLCVRSVSSGGD